MPYNYIPAQLQRRSWFQSLSSHQSLGSSTAVWVTPKLLRICWTWRAASPTPNCPVKAASVTATRTSSRVLWVPCRTQSSLGYRQHPQIHLASSSQSIALFLFLSCLTSPSLPFSLSQCITMFMGIEPSGVTSRKKKNKLCFNNVSNDHLNVVWLIN